MSRPKKDSVDYFPHYVNHGKTVKIIQNIYGNDGYAFFYKLLELLGRSHGHFYICKEIQDQEFLASETHLQWGFCTQILQLLANMAIIDQKLWENGVIWMQSFVDSIKDAYKKRGVSVPDKPPMIGFLVPEIPQAGVVSGTDNPQSKVKESKEPPYPPSDLSPKKRPKRVKVSVDYDSEIQKALEAWSPDMRTPVQAFVAVVASENKTGEISQSRVLSLLGELSVVSTTTAPDIFRYAILEANRRKVGNVGYLKAIITRKAAEVVGNDVDTNGDTAPRPPPQPYYREGKGDMWTRVDPDGTETTMTRDEMILMQAKERTKDAASQAPAVMKLITGIAQAMG